MHAAKDGSASRSNREGHNFEASLPDWQQRELQQRELLFLMAFLLFLQNIGPQPQRIYTVSMDASPESPNFILWNHHSFVNPVQKDAALLWQYVLQPSAASSFWK